eukprot:GFUD01019909.1.p1 GENE.GFUD01019909.1~~GFUD01019909.1.p1  ORF type:complete len:453 (-),score=134.64 GFUD01019909.1:217-1575(-)
MDIDFESSEEEEGENLKIVIKEVCSVLDIEQGRQGLRENPLFSEDTDSCDDSNVGVSASKDEDYIHVKESPDDLELTNVNNNKTTSSEQFNRKTAVFTSLSRSRSTSSEVAPNQGLPDDHEQGQADEYGQVPAQGCVGPVGSLVWAKMKGYPSWPAIVVPDPVTGRSREFRGKQGGEWRHVLFLEYKNEIAWMLQDQLKVFSSKGTNKMKGRNKSLVKAVELANSLTSFDCRDRIRRFTDYQQGQVEGQGEVLRRNTKGIAVGLVWAKLSMKPVVQLKRVKVQSKPFVMLERIKVIESDTDSDDSANDSEDVPDISSEVPKFTKLKPPPSPPTGWCEGHLVWARVQGYPYWPAVIVREQKSEQFCTPSKGGMMRLHVMFLAYQKQHAWLSETALVPFQSADQFKTIIQSGEKNSQKDFTPTKKLAPKFTAAVKVAMELLPTSLYNRLEYLYT